MEIPTLRYFIKGTHVKELNSYSKLGLKIFCTTQIFYEHVQETIENANSILKKSNAVKIEKKTLIIFDVTLISGYKKIYM